MTTRSYKPTPQAVEMMGKIAKPYTHSMEVRSNNLRDWYNRGQEMFRLFHNDPSKIQDFEFEDEVHREGFLMGWNSDAWALSNGKPLAVLGGVRYEPEDWNNAE